MVTILAEEVFGYVIKSRKQFNPVDIRSRVRIACDYKVKWRKRHSLMDDFGRQQRLFFDSKDDNGG
jgi:hypothetical protein